MKSTNLILLAAIGAAVLLVVKKQAQSAGMTVAQKQQAGLLYTPQQQQSVNMNGDMWSRLLGGGWQNLVSTQYSDGSPAFLKNVWGQVTTSDGKPVDGGDPMAAYIAASTGLPATTHEGPTFPSAIDEYIPGGSALLGW
jgi:hypothetical protein